jgi:acyl-CoA reductase-like NAD-dependent aldehyde dehydrogenase
MPSERDRSGELRAKDRSGELRAKDWSGELRAKDGACRATPSARRPLRALLGLRDRRRRPPRGRPLRAANGRGLQARERRRLGRGADRAADASTSRPIATRRTRRGLASGAMLAASYPLYVANRPRTPNTDLTVVDKYSGAVATRVPLADPATLDEAIVAAERAAPAMRELPPYARKAVLSEVTRRVRDRAEELAVVLAVEAGKPIRDARGEVTRLVDTFELAAEEAVRIETNAPNLEISPRARGYRGFAKRVPVGPCSFITPFNFPLNLVAHKVAPAIAAGCPFVLKPSERTPVSELVLGEILAATDLPEGAFSIVPCRIEDSAPLVSDERFALLSFTGSERVGWDMKARAGKKKVVLELGGNAACIVDEDQRRDLDYVVERVVFGAFYQSGQSCISVQRVLAHDEIYDDLRRTLVDRTRALVAGDPRDEGTFVGPMIDEAAARRVEAAIASAKARGATVLAGGARRGAMLEATVLEGVPRDEPLSAEEVFGPVVVLERVASFDEALAIANASRFGLQAGVFTHDLRRAMRAWDELEVGGVVVGDIPSFRVDNMPYGGVKSSGLGREGVRYAIEDMTETRLLVVRTRDA